MSYERVPAMNLNPNAAWVLVGKKQNKTKKKVGFQKLRKTKNCDDNSWFVFLQRSVYNEDEWFKAHDLGNNWAPPNELEMILISKFLINPYQFLQSLRRSFRNQPPKKATSQMRKKNVLVLKKEWLWVKSLKYWFRILKDNLIDNAKVYSESSIFEK